MLTSDNGANFEDEDSSLSYKAFSSDHKQHQVQHQQNHFQLSLFDLPSPYPFQCFSDNFNDPEGAGLNHDRDLDLILFHHQQLQLKQQQNQQPEWEATVDFVLGKDEGETKTDVSVAPGMRRSRKDRHSKITTARGPRDRRMRLSLEVAREFFDVQDLLGFDTASKTVEWLISQSKSAIKEIFRKAKASGGRGGIADSYASDCEIGYDHNSEDDGRDPTMESSANQEKSNKVRKPRKPKKSNSHRRLISTTRESRRQARERAKERTLKSSRLSLIKLDNGEESSCIQTGTMGSKLEILTESEEIAPGRIGIDFSSNLICSYRNPAPPSSSNLNLQEISIPNHSEVRNFEQFLKQWEACHDYGYNPSY
ncbi:hypothetical protein MLD38_023993 [Melastoma candidum]|uniref:Uncharacterized protein n=1 Tax=Melastoma candidum TaxID=119954 RepID=A0ACB9NS85_9MYRT|nr:hypothetical protein MLD38_023993 [Melastoma candidum]